MFDNSKGYRKTKYKKDRLCQESCNFDWIGKISTCLEKLCEESESGSCSDEQENPIQQKE